MVVALMYDSINTKTRVLSGLGVMSIEVINGKKIYLEKTLFKQKIKVAPWAARRMAVHTGCCA